MRKEWEFVVNGHQVKVVKTWTSGAKLFVDDINVDADASLLSFGKTPLLKASLGEDKLEIYLSSDLAQVMLDAYVIGSDHGRKKVFSSTPAKAPRRFHRQMV